jgi:archaemetzincin
MLSDIVIHPFGEIGGNIVETVRVAVGHRFGVNASVGAGIAVPVRAYSREREQYDSTALLDELAVLRRDDKRTRLGVTAVDLFVPGLNFVFGEASSADRVAVFSTARLGLERNGEPTSEALFGRRSITEALHELGHAFGLGHCTRQDCVMWFSNTLAETDRKGSKFCQRCARQFQVH